MISKLLIKNIILIDFAEIEFTQGLNIITGESGSGKSALLTALGLIVGRKGNQDLIRQGQENAFVEATFLVHDKDVQSLLNQEEISSDNQLTIRREIFKSGKNRIFINDQLSSITFLRTLGSKLIQLSDQNSHEELNAESYQRNLLDLFANLKSKVQEFGKNFDKEKELQGKLNSLLENVARNRSLKEHILEDVDQINSANLLPNEEEQLSEEHHLLTHSQDILEKIAEIQNGLYENPHPILPRIGRFIHNLESLAINYPRFQEAFELLKSAKIEIEEAARLLVKDTFEVEPKRIAYIEERLQIIESLKKKFGANIDEAKLQLEKKLNTMEEDQEEIATLQNNHKSISDLNNNLCQEIHNTRITLSTDFQSRIANELKALNLSNSQFQIDIQSGSRTREGEDRVAFLFSANPGTPVKRIDDCASGGELSRLMLAIQSTLAEKGDAKTLIFDEIDANVGGKTASLIGEKLRSLGTHRQIICVTHFVQVAKFANRHLLVKKLQKQDQTITNIESLNSDSQKQEFNRMIGE